MYQFIKSWIMPVLMLLLLVPTAYSQTTGLNSKGDTIICNTIGQYRFWQTAYFKSKELQRLLDVSELARLKLEKAEYEDSLAITELKVAIKEKQTELDITNNQVVAPLKQQVKELNKAVVRQKIYKWVAVIVGGASTGFMSYLYVKSRFL